MKEQNVLKDYNLYSWYVIDNNNQQLAVQNQITTLKSQTLELEQSNSVLQKQLQQSYNKKGLESKIQKMKESYEVAYTTSFVMDHLDDLAWLMVLPLNLWHWDYNYSRKHGIEAWLLEQYHDPILKFEANIRLFSGIAMSWITGNGYFIINELLKSQWANKIQTNIAIVLSDYTDWESIQVNNILSLIVGTSSYFIAYGFGLISLPTASLFAGGYVVYSIYSTPELDIYKNLIIDAFHIDSTSNLIINFCAVTNAVYEVTDYLLRNDEVLEEVII